jgi:hypothetical protein
MRRYWHTYFCEVLESHASHMPEGYLAYVCNFRNLLWPLTLAKTRLFAFDGDVCFLPLADLLNHGDDAGYSVFQFRDHS